MQAMARDERSGQPINIDGPSNGSQDAETIDDDHPVRQPSASSIPGTLRCGDNLCHLRRVMIGMLGREDGAVC
jgi:hypothetical protein